METYAKCVLRKNGEGVMLRKPHSLYEHGRSDSILKYKVWPLFTKKNVNNKYSK